MVAGGNFDVDVVLTDPMGNEIYKEKRKEFDSYTFTASMTGEYAACFSNKFSSFTPKLVYVDFQVGPEEALPGVGQHHTAMTQVL